MKLRGALVRSNQSAVPMVSKHFSTGELYGRRRSLDDSLLSTYESVGTVYAIVHSLAVATSKLDWKLFRPAKSGLKEDRTEVTSHAAVDMWNKPNPFMPRRRFMETAQQHIDLTGESDILVSSMNLGGKGIPLELWPMRPDRILPVPDPYKFLAGYIYVSPDGERIPLDVTECLPILMPNPRDPYRGLGPIQAVLTTIESMEAADEWDRAFYQNSAEPGGIIEVGTSLSDPQFDELRDRWAATHRGVSKAHRVAILEAGMKWVDRSYSQRDMQHGELRSIKRDAILEAFGFPKPMLGITEDVNRANAEAAEYVYSKWLISERADRWKDWLNHQFMPLYGNTGADLMWDYESPVSENTDTVNAGITARSAALVAMAGAGFDATETQQWLDVPEIPYTKPAPPPPPVIAAPGKADPNADPKVVPDGP